LRLYFVRSFITPLLVRFHESRWVMFRCLRERLVVRSLSEDMATILYFSYKCLIEPLVIRLTEGATWYFQRVAIGLLTRADPDPDMYHINNSLFSAQKFPESLRYLSDGATEGGP
jgi:hypothetical protein